MRMIIHVEVRRNVLGFGWSSTHCSAYITSAGVTFQGTTFGGYNGFAEIMVHARDTQRDMVESAPGNWQERVVSVIGELPTRVAEFYCNADKTPYCCEPGRSRLAQLLTAYLTGQDIPLEAIWDYIQEFVLTN